VDGCCAIDCLIGLFVNLAVRRAAVLAPCV
jgi:hypothetical protein